MAQMYTIDRQLQAMSHDPVREVSWRVEQMAIDKVKEDILKLTGVVAVVVAILAPVCLQIFSDVSFSHILQTAQVLHMAGAAVILQIMVCKMVSHTALVAWQMSDPGSNVLGSICKMLNKLGWMEYRLQQIEKIVHRDRVVLSVVRDAVAAGDSWGLLKKELDSIKAERADSLSTTFVPRDHILAQFRKEIDGAVTFLTTYMKNLRNRLEVTRCSWVRMSDMARYEAGEQLLVEMIGYLALLDWDIKKNHYDKVADFELRRQNFEV